MPMFNGTDDVLFVILPCCVESFVRLFEICLDVLTKARGYAYAKIEYVSVRTYLSENRIRV